MTTHPPRYRRPSAGPSQSEVADAARWTALADSSLSTTQAVAEKWRTGLAAFVTLVTAGLLLKGPEAAQDIPRPWLALLTALAVAGMATAIAGLWLALRAAAGSPAQANLIEVTRVYGGVRQFETIAARAAAGKLKWSRRLVAASLLLLGGTVFVWWWIPSTADAPAAYLQVELADTTECGTLDSADGQVIVLDVEGQSSPAEIPLEDVENLRVVDAC